MVGAGAAIRSRSGGMNIKLGWPVTNLLFRWPGRMTSFVRGDGWRGGIVCIDRRRASDLVDAPVLRIVQGWI